MDYVIPVTGFISVTGLSNANAGGSWDKYWKSMPDFEKYDCFSFSSADFHNPLYARFETLTGIDISKFEDQLKNQKMAKIYGFDDMIKLASVRKDTKTNQLYLNMPQSGCGLFFKIHEINPE